MSCVDRLLKAIRRFYQQINDYSAKIDGPAWFVKADMLWCGLIYGASPSNYFNFDFRHASGKERRTFVTHRISNRLMRTLNDPEKLEIMTNKYLFAKRYTKFYHRRFLNSVTMSIQDFSELVGEGSRIICKPICGGQGKGISCYTVNNNAEAVYWEIKKLPECIVETWIKQDPEMSKLYPWAVNPLRLQTVRYHGQTKYMGATLTVGLDSEISNASAKALFALVDVNTGIVFTDACDYEYNVYRQHPVTGVEFKGFAIPRWEEIKKLVLEASAITPEIGYVGWDVAVSVDGPIIIEANNDPGYTAYQLPVLLGKHCGTKALYVPFLKF